MRPVMSRSKVDGNVVGFIRTLLSYGQSKSRIKGRYYGNYELNTV